MTRKQLKSPRKTYGWSQTEIAEMVGIHRGTLSRWGGGHIALHPLTVDAIRKAVGELIGQSLKPQFLSIPKFGCLVGRSYKTINRWSEADPDFPIVRPRNGHA